MPVNDKNRGLRSANRRSDACMATVQESIEVNVPLSQAYNQWTQFEEFPHFMSGVESVNQLDDTTVHFKTSIGGVRREYDARITAQEPDQRVSWESLDEPRNAGTVWFDDLGEAATKVNVELTWEPDSAAEKIGAAIGLDSRQVAADLKKFKQFIEERGAETGGWRGRVDPVAPGATTAVPLQEEVGYGAEPAFERVDADPDLAPEPPFRHDQPR